ncbi:MAG: CDP-glycerol glycerophosphotransferase family protein [Chloroflexi bacterium]|nr:CDP-glycerol glycerophosphotransferase family protein [Chloroflexota bacterium]
MTTLELTLTRIVLGAVAAVARRLPVRREVLFASSRDRQLGPQLAAISAALTAADPSLPQREQLAPYGYGLTAKVAYLLHLIGATWALQRARVTVIDNAWLPAHITTPRAGCSVIQVWHAEGAYKRFGHATRGASSGADGALHELIHSGYTDALVSSESVRPAYAEAFRMPLSNVHAVGPLRGAWLASPASVALRKTTLLAQYPELSGKRVLLYAPTFRGRGAQRETQLTISPDTIAAALPSDWILAIKAHPLVPITVQATGAQSTSGRCVTLNAATPVDELFPIADALFTDYSSSIFLWSLLERPLLLAVADAEAYAQDPGLFLDPRSSDSIGIRVNSVQEVVAALTAVGSSAAVDQERQRAFAERYLGPRDALADGPQRAAAMILERLDAKRTNAA